MKIYKYLTIFIFIISCSANKGVYWCGDHACANNKEKEAYFKKTMIVEVRNLNKKGKNKDSENEKILKQYQPGETKLVIKSEELDQQIELEEEQRANEAKRMEEQLKLEEEQRANEAKRMEEQLKLEEEQILNEEKNEQKTISTFKKSVEISEASSMNFDDLVDKILARNSSRSFPKINDIPK